VYAAAVLVSPTRQFFALTLPSIGMLATAVIASGVAIVGLMLCGFSVGLTRDGPASDEA
jgi:hypothetical protein